MPPAFVPAVLALTQAALALALLTAQTPAFDFVLLGDRTGEAQPGVYEQIWGEISSEKPAFVLSVGDTIQGLDDRAAPGQWEQVQTIFNLHRAIPVYLTPGNHDVWSDASRLLFQKIAHHPPHYSFDWGDLHITVLDNSRGDQFDAAEMDFLASDLQSHSRQPVKLIVSHRPSWLLAALLGDSASPFHQLVHKYGVQYVVAGHLHEMLRLELQGVTYISMPSAGGHLRASKRYNDGWFFGHVLVRDQGGVLHFRIEEAKAPAGGGRITGLANWGPAGLTKLPDQMRQSR